MEVESGSERPLAIERPKSRKKACSTKLFRSMPNVQLVYTCIDMYIVLSVLYKRCYQLYRYLHVFYQLIRPRYGVTPPP